jgi:hypothetical protein
MDCGELGVAAVTNTEDSQSSEKAALPERAITEWTATEIAPASDEPIQAAVDGEALVFDSPLVLSIQPKDCASNFPRVWSPASSRQPRQKRPTGLAFPNSHRTLGER